MLLDVLRKRLEAFGALPQEDVAFLNALSLQSRLVKAGADIIREGTNPEDVHLVISGLACRYKTLQNGKRAIVAYLLPGDFCDLHVFILQAMDHSISALAECIVVKLPRATILSMLERPAVARLLLMATLVDEATLREWVTNIGQRPASERIAHLFCELYLRMRVIDAVKDHTFELPITQSELADTVGLSIVHVNKSLRKLRAANAVTFKGGRLVITDIELLKKLGGFKSNYLHLDDVLPSLVLDSGATTRPNG